MIDQSLFSSAHAALIFAFNASGQAYDRPMMNRLAAPALGSGKGLGGLDGAGQAGMIRQEVARLGRLPEAILIARFAPRSRPCSCRSACCSGQQMNKEWIDSIAYLYDHIRTTALAGCVSNGSLRREYVIRYFTRKDQRRPLESIASRFEVHRDTVSAHYNRIANFFGGTRKGTEQSPGFEEIARNAIEDKLRELAVVG